MKWSQNPKKFELYSYFDDELLSKFETEKVTFENHWDGILLNAYDKYSELRDAFDIISTARDLNDVEYVATV